ncbi:MAG: diphosphomevalonate decarboxylase [Hyphomicrobiales bacterium]
MNITNKEYKWRSPSNIALIKYWGKFELQKPCNPSLSFSLSNCHTTTSVSLKEKYKGNNLSIDFLFHGMSNKPFENRILNFLNQINSELPWMKHFHMSINSENSFPHSSGIASSASAMAALSLCLAEIDAATNQTQVNKQFASYIARIGSGSASRSIYGGYNLWGEHPEVNNSSNDYAITIDDSKFNELYQNICDCILIVSSGEKEKSSSSGHRLMTNHPYAESRFSYARKNLSVLLETLKFDDWHKFAEIVEHEALNLHALMMSSKPSYLLLKPNTIEIIEKIRAKREQSDLKVCFTLDAGSNVHLLFPGNQMEKVKLFIINELSCFCENNCFINDHIGCGSENLNQ